MMIDIPLLKWLLVTVNWTIFALLFMLMCEHFYAGNKLSSYSTIFYVLSFLWLLLKGVFWLLTVFTDHTWEAFEFYMLYWVPVPLEICSFMLVPLFFVNMLYPRQWIDYRIYVRPFYVALTCGLTILTIIWSLLAAVSSDSKNQCIRDYLNDHKKDKGSVEEIALVVCFRTEYAGIIFRTITAFCFLFLSCTQGLFGVKLLDFDDWQQLRMLAIRKEILSHLNVFLCFSFVSRVIYQALAIFWDFHFANIPLDGSSDVQISLFLMIILWDYLPTLLLLLYVVSPTLQGNLFTFRSRAGSRTFSIDESEPLGRHRTDTGFTSDGGDNSVQEEGVWNSVKRMYESFKRRLTNGDCDTCGALDDTNVGVPLNYDVHGPESYFPMGDDRLNNNSQAESNFPTEAMPLMPRGHRSLGGNRNFYGSDSSSNTDCLDPMQRFQQPPVLPRAPRNAFRISYPYHGDQDTSDNISFDSNISSPLKYQNANRYSQFNTHDQRYYHSDHKVSQYGDVPQDHMITHAQNFWSNNNKDANYDPDLYAYSAIPRSHASQTSLNSPSNKGVSPLDMHLQRDTSAHKYASYAPHAPTPPDSIVKYNNNSTEPIVKNKNKPSALDSALGAFKKTHYSHLTNDQSDNFGLDRMMSPSAMSQNSPSETPSEFTLSSRVTGNSSSSGVSRQVTSWFNPTTRASNLNPATSNPIPKNESNRPQLSSRPSLRSSSENFMNLVSLAQENEDSSKSITHEKGGKQDDAENA